MVRRVGILGYGNLGKYLLSVVNDDDEYHLAFVWNRSKEKLSCLPPEFILHDISDFASKRPDVVVEVAHPSITRRYGASILKHCDYMVGSPTALSDESLYSSLQMGATEHGLYVPSGAFWGGEDIRKLSDCGRIQSLTVTMKKHPASLKLEGHLKEKNTAVTEETVLFHGPVRDICGLAPHNVNTMAVAAIAAPSLGFDGVVGRLVADPSLEKYHIVEVDVQGFPKEDGTCFQVRTVRRNPANLGEVTGQATFLAYAGSLKRAVGRGPGVHLC